MSRPHRPLDGPAAAARAELPDSEAASFDRLAAAVLAHPGTALGPTLRAQLPGTEGVRWLHSVGLAPTTPAADLDAGQWLSLYRSWSGSGRAPASGGPGGRGKNGRPSSAHGHAPGAHAIPRWGQ
jgi:hypothetical protein